MSSRRSRRKSRARDKNNDPKPEAPLYKVIAAVAAIPNDDLGWEEWNKHGMAIYAATGGSEEGLAIFDFWSKKSQKYDEQITADKWTEYHKTPPDRIGAGSIFYWASATCPQWDVLAYERSGSIAMQMAEVVEILGLAKLSIIQYEQQRKEAAKRLNIRTSALDEIVARLRPRGWNDDDDTEQGTRLTFALAEPWPDAVDGESLITNMMTAIRSHVILNEHQALAMSLWVMHTHVIDLAEHSPRLQIRSPTHRCGKTTAMRTISPMVLKPLSTENITLAALFRVIEMCQPTLLIDEADSFLKREDGRDNEELRGIMNAGHARGGEVIRTVGEDHEPRCFKVYAPLAFAWLVRKGRHAPETLEDRSITIELRRRLKEEKITRLRSNRMGHLEALGRQAMRWAMDHRNLLSDADPMLPDELGDRAQDNWRMLIAIADAISVKLGEEARTAAKKIAEEHVGIEDDHSVQALADVAAIAKTEAVTLKKKGPDGEWLKGISSGDLVNALIKMEDRPWSEWRRGQPLTKTSLARLLKPFNLRPRTILFPEQQGRPEYYAKGYDVGPIEEANRRFVDKETEDAVEPF